MVEQTFLNLVNKYTTGERRANELWAEITKAYTHKKRHYHTLTHLENMIEELDQYRPRITDWDTTLFAVFYHDIVYNVLKQNNEEKSAMLAVNRMTSLAVPAEKIEKCKAMILATKAHQITNNPDTDLFTDADLAILGQPWNTYENYTRQIRAEYAIYPDIMYKPGRKKVLAHFLAMKRIYKTEQFYAQFERAARENMERELIIL
jgi:predicted metal-dependent HD superfamily phosphohydrolase